MCLIICRQLVALPNLNTQVFSLYYFNSLFVILIIFIRFKTIVKQA